MIFLFNQIFVILYFKNNNMQTLLFNTTTKSVKLYEGLTSSGKILSELENIPTVKVLDGYYEVIQKDEFDRPFPVLRLPIANTNMLIKK